MSGGVLSVRWSDKAETATKQMDFLGGLNDTIDIAELIKIKRSEND